MLVKLFAGLSLAVVLQSAHGQVPDAAQFNAQFQHHTARVNNVKLHYVIGGQGPVVVLLHGFPETWYAWRHVMPRLAVNHTVIVPDLRGAGESEKPLDGYDTRNMAEDIHQLVLRLGFKQIDLVGHDFGVAVAYAYAAAHRDEVSHLVLLDVPPQGTAQFAKLAASSWVFRFQQQRNLSEALVAGRERMYLTEGFFRAFAYNPDAFTEQDIDEYVRAYSAPGAMRAAFEWYRAFDEDIRENQEYLKRKLPMPVLALGGAESGGPMMKATADEIAVRGTAGSIEQCGHWMLDEQPQEVGERIQDFIENVE